MIGSNSSGRKIAAASTIFAFSMAVMTLCWPALSARDADGICDEDDPSLGVGATQRGEP
jgi:hypothetical protein